LNLFGPLCGCACRRTLHVRTDQTPCRAARSPARRRTSARQPLIQSERRLSSSLEGMPFSRMYTGTPSVDAYEIALYRLGGYTGSAGQPQGNRLAMRRDSNRVRVRVRLGLGLVQCSAVQVP